jgi:hypothetical protein
MLNPKHQILNSAVVAKSTMAKSAKFQITNHKYQTNGLDIEKLEFINCLEFRVYSLEFNKMRGIL